MAMVAVGEAVPVTTEGGRAARQDPTPSSGATDCGAPRRPDAGYIAAAAKATGSRRVTQAQNPPLLLCKRPLPAAVPAPSPVGVAAARPTDRLRRGRPEVPLPLGAWPALPSPPGEGRERLRVRRAAGGGLRGQGS